jgi:hypothetical protein
MILQIESAKMLEKWELNFENDLNNYMKKLYVFFEKYSSKKYIQHKNYFVLLNLTTTTP